MPALLIAKLAGVARKGIGQIVQNVRLGQQAKAGGFIQPTQQAQQAAQQSSAVASTQNRTLIIVGSVVGLFVLIFALKKK